ncbi:Reverse transcriptase-rnase h-integrase [Phytophthora palmivora]|uniref:Reverse transcriptase-rnase h-integrase n=1 Tax=Phytophthora palmivora TaxID=4796 RepID=A0A2P4Y709_9STRA|nr:Reverse transcriptase-rnase h-integrase [Phytophthora palmivora]
MAAWPTPRSQKNLNKGLDLANYLHNITHLSLLAVLDETSSFSVVCDASDYTIVHMDDEGHQSVISFQSRQLKAAERNYSAHGKELVAIQYALAKFGVLLLDSRTFVINTDHAALRAATNSPHLSQRTAR